MELDSDDLMRCSAVKLALKFCSDALIFSNCDILELRFEVVLSALELYCSEYSALEL